jgi:hypothetical protein
MSNTPLSRPWTRFKEVREHNTKQNGERADTEMGEMLMGE